MRILGVDPGSIHTGYGLVEKRGSKLVRLAQGRLSYPSRNPLPERLACLSRDFAELVDRLQPGAAALETPFLGRSSRSLIVLAQARGALLAVLALRAITIHEYSPAEIKSAVSGNGRAGKEQVARMVKLLLAASGDDWAVDTTDALAAAICCGNRLRVDAVMSHKSGRK